VTSTYAVQIFDQEQHEVVERWPAQGTKGQLAVLVWLDENRERLRKKYGNPRYTLGWLTFDR